MPPKNKPTNPDVAAEDTPIGSDAPPADSGNGVKPAPYDATWINVAGASKLAGVTSQTVRNAYRDHPAFNPSGEGAKPAWFTTKMVDAFGNVTDYDVVYLDKSAVDAWIVARAEKPTTGNVYGGAKRRIVRLTEEQIAAQPKMTLADGTEVPAITLVDGTMVALEVPPMGNKRKSDSNGTETAATTDEAPATDGADPGATLFDVALEEAPAA